MGDRGEHKGEATGNVYLHCLHNPKRNPSSTWRDVDVLLHIWWATVQLVTEHWVCTCFSPQSYVNLLFWYQFFCGFSGNTMIDYWQMIFFNLFFTSLPPLVFGVLDRDVSAETLLSLPELYKNGQNSEVCLDSWSNCLVSQKMTVVLWEGREEFQTQLEPNDLFICSILLIATKRRVNCNYQKSS